MADSILSPAALNAAKVTVDPILLLIPRLPHLTHHPLPHLHRRDERLDLGAGCERACDPDVEAASRQDADGPGECMIIAHFR